MLTTLMDFPFADRHKLVYWSDCAVADVNAGTVVDSEAKRLEILTEALECFTELWHERAAAIRGSIWSRCWRTAKRLGTSINRPGISRQPDAVDRRRQRDDAQFDVGRRVGAEPESGRVSQTADNPGLIPSMVPEIIRWQTPVVHMRRTALADAELGGKQIRKGDKVVMWYISGNRDEEAIRGPTSSSSTARGRGSICRSASASIAASATAWPRCSLGILWEEILKRGMEMMDEPKRIYSNFIHGITSMPVRIPDRALATWAAVHGSGTRWKSR